MRLKNDYLFFDEFPMRFDPKAKLIITHLLHLDERNNMPQKLPTIYTTKKLANQLRMYCEFRNYTCITENTFVIVEPYTIVDISLEPRKSHQFFFCESQEISGHLMVLIKENGIVDKFYAGNLLDIRTPILDDTFAEWASPGVNELYINLKRANMDIANVEDIELIDEAIEEVVKTLGKIGMHKKLHLRMPLFGYEHFIAQLSMRLIKRVCLSNKYKYFFQNLAIGDHATAMDNFGTETEHRVFITDLKPDKSLPAHYKTVTIDGEPVQQIEGSLPTENDIPTKIYYSPEPSVLDLQTLCRVVKTQNLYAIIDCYNSKSIVPKYLVKFTMGYKKKQMSKEKALTTTSVLQDVTVVPATQNSGPTKIIVGAKKSSATAKGPYLSDSDNDDD